MTSFYDGQPPPPSRKERIARDGTMSYRAKQWVDEKIPLYFEPTYEKPPRSKRTELLFLGGIVTLLVIVGSWGLNTLDVSYPDETVADLPRLERIRDEQLYDDISQRPLMMGAVGDWQLDGDVDADDEEYFDEVVYYMGQGELMSYAAEVAASTFPHIEDGRNAGIDMGDPADWPGWSDETDGDPGNE